MALIKENLTYVDGYNIINKRPELKKLSKQSLESSRHELIESLAEYSHLTDEKIILVFDAYNLERLKETILEKYGMKIVFTKRFQTADTFIEKELERVGRRHNVKVVTDDGAVQNLALAKGAARVTALELKGDLDILKGKIKRAKKKDFSQNYGSFPMAKELLDKLDQLKIKLEEE